MYVCTTAKLHQQHRDIPNITRARDQKIKTTHALVNKSVSNMSKDNQFFYFKERPIKRGFNSLRQKC